MGEIDSFLNATVTPLLSPGEQVHGFGHVKEATRRNLLNVPEVSDHWLVAATNTRLIAFRTPNAGGMFDQKPKPQATDPQSFWYDEVERIHGQKRDYHPLMPGGCPQTFGFVPRPQLGPFDGRVFSFDIYNVAEGIDGQERFAKEFLPWLSQQVAAGAFPVTPEKQAQIDARLAAAAQRMQAQRAANEAAAAKRVAWLKLNGPLLVAVALFFGAVFGAFVAFNDLSHHRAEDVEKHQADLNKFKKSVDEYDDKVAACKAGESCFCGTEPPTSGKDSDYDVITVKATKQKIWCLPKSWYKSTLKDYEKRYREADSERTFALFEVIGAFVGMALALGLGVGALLWRRKKLRAAT
jgi:hypothetical protein